MRLQMARRKYFVCDKDGLEMCFSCMYLFI
jgi:hypothetical protein